MIAFENKFSLPYAIISVLLLIVLILFGMMAMRTVLVAIAFSILLASVLYLLIRRLNKGTLGPISNIIISLVVATTLVAGLIVFIDWQLVTFIRAILNS